MGGAVPVGLAMNAVGAHPIEAWLSTEALLACGITTDCNSGMITNSSDATVARINTGINTSISMSNSPGLTGNSPNSKIYYGTIVPMHPFTFGTMLWYVIQMFCVFWVVFLAFRFNL